MKVNILPEIPLWILLILPILYLIHNWDLIPDSVALHYNFFGVADQWGDKTNLIYLNTLVPGATYLILLLATYLDPRQKIQRMGAKFYHIRFFFSAILAIILFGMSYTMVQGYDNFQDFIFVILGIVFLFLGNYFKNLKPNYFIGFRTPWALENDEVWRTTHQSCSIVWFVGGLIMMVINALFSLKDLWFFNYSIVLLLILAPLFFSYFKYQSLKKNPQ